MSDTNSRRTRVLPVFDVLMRCGGNAWPQQLIELATGLGITLDAGSLVECHYREEVTVPASPERLAWLIRNAERLAPADGRNWRAYRNRVIDNPAKDAVLAQLDRGDASGLPKELCLEGATSCDCLIECERAVIWIEGKRFDWLSPCTTWDVTRDQLSRNLEAAWILGSQRHKEFCVLLCHEDHGLKYHEELLLSGYRSGTWRGGWPHLDEATRAALGARVGTVTWQRIQEAWPETGPLP